MRQIDILLGILLLLSAGDLNGQISSSLQKRNNNSDTIKVRFSMCGTTREDTVVFDDPLKKDGLRRYFQRNLRCSFDEDSGVSSCKLYFIVDKEGHTTAAWCEAGANPELVKEVTRVAKKLPVMLPSYVKGKPVVTRVETRITYVHDDASTSKWDNYETDILIIYSIQHRKSHSMAGTMLRKE